MQKAPVLVISAPTPRTRSELLQRNDFRFVARDVAETSTEMKQVIPYIIISDGSRLLAYRRATTSNEKRLIEKVSLGWGGHIEEIDAPNDPRLGLEAFIENCAVREIREELNLGLPAQRQFLGLIDDPSDSVGRVHLAYVELWVYPALATSISEVAIELDTASEIFWLERPYAESQLPFESWSSIGMRMLEQ